MITGKVKSQRHYPEDAPGRIQKAIETSGVYTLVSRKWPSRAWGTTVLITGPFWKRGSQESKRCPRSAGTAGNTRTAGTLKSIISGTPSSWFVTPHRTSPEGMRSWPEPAAAEKTHTGKQNCCILRELRLFRKTGQTFREARQSFWFFQLLIQLESSGHSVSPAGSTSTCIPITQRISRGTD